MIGKYLAVLTVTGILLLLLLLMPLSLLLGGTLDLGTTAAGILGLILLLASYGAVGLFFSSLTRQPAIAAVSSYGLLLLLWILDLAGGSLFSNLGMSGHFQRLTSGLVVSSDILYFLLLTGLSLVLTVRRLDTLRSEQKPPNGAFPFARTTQFLRFGPRVAGRLARTLYRSPTNPGKLSFCSSSAGDASSWPGTSRQSQQAHGSQTTVSGFNRHASLSAVRSI